MSDNTTESNSRDINRRRVIAGVGAIGIGGALIPGSALARPPAGGPPGRPDHCECPEETFLAKYEFVQDDDECHFEFEDGEDVIDILGWDDKPDEPCEPVTVRYEAHGYDIHEICAFGGRDTDTDTEPDGEFESNLTNPGGQQAAISYLVFCGEPLEEPPECADLTLEYECTTYEFEDPDNWRRTGTRYRVRNHGDADTSFGRAITNDVNVFREISHRSIDAGSDRSLIGDASNPLRAIIFWEDDIDCAEYADLETWEAFKSRRGFDDLTDFFDDQPPADAPADLPDDVYVAEAENIPDGEPEENIPDDRFPDMADEYEEAGWIACAKVDTD